MRLFFCNPRFHDILKQCCSRDHEQNNTNGDAAPKCIRKMFKYFFISVNFVGYLIIYFRINIDLVFFFFLCIELNSLKRSASVRTLSNCVFTKIYTLQQRI